MGARTKLFTSIAVIVAALGASWLATYALGGAGHVAPHWFYIPIMIAATRFGPAGAVPTALVCGLLAGPLMPQDVASGTGQDLSDWLSRAGFFLGNSVIMAAVVGRLRGALARERAIAGQERELQRHKEAVISTVSHEFRTPLTVLRGSVNTLAQRDLVAPGARPLIEGLDRAIRRLDSLVQVVVAASRAMIDSHRPRAEPVDLRAVCAEAAGPERTSRVRFQAEPGAETVLSDPELLCVLLHAIVDNALKFSPTTAAVEITCRRRSDAAVISVSDAGPGISEAYRARAFEAFTRQDESDARSTEGLGIGLFAARKIAELLGGVITLEPRPSGGTTVTITLPQRRARDAATTRPSRIASA